MFLLMIKSLPNLSFLTLCMPLQSTSYEFQLICFPILGFLIRLTLQFNTHRSDMGAAV
jgi:hypothetical protein